jgi:4-hydroxy-tetrahydrodipicolinate reductase
MNFVLLGHGKTGSLVAEVGRERGHQVHVVGSEENAGGSALSRERLHGVDAVIDFTTPHAVIPNIIACIAADANMVVGTTGWYDKLGQIQELVERRGTGFVYGSNFSVGVNVFFGIARAAAAATQQGYTVRLLEKHHAEKKDSPSGTAVTIRKELGLPADYEITSVREGETVGQHVILLDSPSDTMMLVHDAKSRRGFAEGAVRAAEWVAGKKGFFDFKDVFAKL